MRFIATTSQIRSQPFRFIPFVHAQPEPLARSARLEGIERIRNQLYVVRICSGDNQCKRKLVPVSHQTALYAPFSPVCWVLACFFEPASGDLVIQPSIDNHDQSIASNCSQATRFARSVQIRQHPATPEIGDEQSLTSIYRWHLAHSTGNPS